MVTGEREGETRIRKKLRKETETVFLNVEKVQE
jgi:hypothetical protein